MAPLVNPFQYHTIGSGAGGAGEATAPPSENKREPQPLPSQKFMYVSKHSNLPHLHVQFKMPRGTFKRLNNHLNQFQSTLF